MRKLSIRQTGSATYVADSVVATDIERMGLLTRIDMVIEITPSATLTEANQPDGLNRVLQNMRILGGSHTYFTLPSVDGGQGGTLLHYMNRQDGFGLGHADGAVAAPTRTFTIMKFTLHCGSRPKDLYGRDNPFDLTAFIPAGDESQLRAEWVTSGNDVMDDTVTVGATTMRFILHRVVGTEDEIRQEIAEQRVVTPPGWTGRVASWSAVVTATGGTTSDFNVETNDLVTGGFIKRIGILAQDATADRPLRAGDEVTEIAILSVPTSETLYQVTAEALTAALEGGDQLTVNSGGAESAATEKFDVDFNQSAPLGVYLIDLRPSAQDALGRDYGWDLRAMQTGDLRLGYIITTRAAGDDRLVLFERYIPPDVSLAVAGR